MLSLFDGPVPISTPPPLAVAQSDQTRGSVQPPLLGATSSRRAGDMPYGRIDPRWMRTYLPQIRARAKHLVRNNRHATTAARDLPSEIVGSGIMPILPDEQAKLWHHWSSRRRRLHSSREFAWESFWWLVVRSVMVTGEAFVVLKRQRMGTQDIPVRLEIFDGEGLAEMPARMPDGSEFDTGHEISPAGMTRAWHFRVGRGRSEHNVRVPATDVIHVYDPTEPGQDRGMSWFTPVIIDLAELAGYQDSTAVKQHMASKLTIITTDTDSMGTASQDRIEDLEPGAEVFVPVGRDVKPFQQPMVREYGDFVKVNRSEIAVALGTTPEALSGDYTGMSWTVARASYRNHWKRLESHRKKWLRPAIEEVYAWVAFSLGGERKGWPDVDDLEWQMPVASVLDPDKEGTANLRMVRAGFRSWSDVVRERGHDPIRHMDELQRERAELESRGIVLDSDPNVMTAQGQPTTDGDDGED